MKYIITIVFLAALLPGVGGELNFGLFFMSPLRIALLLLPVFYIGKNILHRNKFKYYIKSQNIYSIIFMTFWFVYSLMSIFWCKDSSLWMHGEYYIGIGIFTMYLFDMSSLKIKDFVDILSLVQIAIIFHNVLGWFEVITHKYLFASPERLAIMRSSKQYYPVSVMLNQNDFVMVLIFGTFISLFLVVTSKTYKFKILNSIMIMSNIGLAVATDSRTGLLGLLLGIVIAGYFLVPRKGILYIFSTIIVVISASVLLFPQVFMGLGEKMQNVSILNFDNPLVNSDAVRLNLIKNGLIFLKETLGVGVGTGNAEYWMATKPLYYVRGFTNLHNWWIEILTNFGIIIFILYIIFFIYLFYSLIKKYKETENQDVRMMCVLFISFMGAFSIACISSSSNWGKEWLWVLWAFIIAFQGLTKEKESINDKKAEYKKDNLLSYYSAVNS